MEINEEEERINIDLFIEIRDKLKDVAKKLRVPKELMSLREKFSKNIKIADPINLNYKIFSLDSSYSVPPVEVLGGELYVYSYGYISNTGKRKLSGGVDIFESSDAVIKKLMKEERKLLLEIIKKESADLIILDGPIANFPGAPFRIPREYVDLMNEVFRAADEKEIFLIGFPKAVRTLYLSMKAEIKDRKKTVYDRVASSYILRSKEYIYLGRLRELLPKYFSYLNEIGIKVHPPLDSIKKVPEYGEVDIVCFKTDVGNKIELYIPERKRAEREQWIEKIIGYLIHLCAGGNSDFPIILDEVDKFVRVSVGDTVSAYMNLLKLASKEAVKDILPLANPQKKYLLLK